MVKILKIMKIRNFFERILNSENPTSSKRFTALTALSLFVASVVCSLFGVMVQPEILYVTSGLTLTCLGLSAFKR
jgi:hypothetical protein